MKCSRRESLSLDQLQDRKLKQTKTAVKQRKQNFLKEYMKNKCSATACSNLKISESTFKRWLKNDNQFKKTMKEFIHYKNAKNLSIFMLRFLIRGIRGHSFSFIELNKYIDFTMNLLVREGI